MPDIDTLLAQMRTDANDISQKAKGEEVRNAISDGINKAAAAIEEAVGNQLIELDATLTQSGKGADAAAVGNALNKALSVKGVLPSQSNIDEIHSASGNASSIYLLESGVTYQGTLPGTGGAGYLYTERISVNRQQIFYKFSSMESNGSGIVWYRNALNDTWRPWIRINIRKNEFDEAINKTLRTTGVLGTTSTQTSLNIYDTSIYALDNANQYSDVPEENPRGFLVTIHQNRLTNQFYIRYSNSADAGNGKMWYRSALDETWSAWNRSNITVPEIETILSDVNTELAVRIKNMNYDGSVSLPKSLFASRSPQSYSSFISPSWITQSIPAVTTAASIIKFGSNSDTNAAVLGVERTTLRTFVMSTTNNTSGNQYAYGNESCAMVKLTSFVKRVCMYGDSIMWGRNGDAADNTDPDYRSVNTIPNVTERNLGIRCFNHGVSEQGWLKPGTDGKTAYQEVQQEDITNAEYAVLAWGVNDRNYIMTNGALDPSKLGTYLSTDGSSLMGNVYNTIDKIYQYNPTCACILVLPWNGRNIGTFPSYKYGETVYSAMVEEIKKFAKYYYIPLIGEDCPMMGWGLKSGSFMGNDGVHPSLTGYKHIANWFSGELGKIIG